MRWSSRSLIDPFTLFHNRDGWRPNPLVDEGHFHVGNVTLRYDSRTDPDNPWSGWFATADFENGRGRYTGRAGRDSVVRDNALVNYSRAFFDLRRYNRLSRQSQLNLRVVAGGWTAGDRLPLERRVSVDGPGGLPGFGFRADRVGSDIGTCTSGATLPLPGRPAMCDRIALAQMEYRGDLHMGFDGDWDGEPVHFGTSHGDVAWVRDSLRQAWIRLIDGHGVAGGLISALAGNVYHQTWRALPTARTDSGDWW